MELKEIGTGFHLLAKPIGPLCNLDCEYCFYTEKSQLYPKDNNFKMSRAVLEHFIKTYIESQDIPEIQFVWQGGEPTLLGIDFFKEVLFYQRKYAGDKTIVNSLQTNGTLIDDVWCRFIKENNILVGISIDGPAFINDSYRKDLAGKPTAHKVIHSIELFNQYKIEYNALICVTNKSSKLGTEIYHFLKNLGVKYIQFTPVVERKIDAHNTQLKTISPFSVSQGDYGAFLIEVFNLWIKEDVGSIFIMNFEWALESWLGLPSTVCIFSKQCGKALAIEHNGDLYVCDHYVDPEHLLGNIMQSDLKELLNQPSQIAFGASKENTLPKACQVCEVKFACNGECPRHRFETTSEGEAGLSYLCKDYKQFFRHIHPYMKVMVKLIENDLPVSKVMEVIKGPLVVVKDSIE